MSDQSESGGTQTLAVIGCGNAKRDEASKARDLYTSNYFGLKREYAEHFADRVVTYAPNGQDIEIKEYDDPIRDLSGVNARLHHDTIVTQERAVSTVTDNTA